MSGKNFTPALILLIVGAALSRAPLFNYLGFEYSAAVALLAPFVPGLFLVRAFRGTGGSPRAILVLSFLVPLGVGLLNALVVKNCSLGQGLAWFGLLPGVTLLWTAGLAKLCAAPGRTKFYLALTGLVLAYPLVLGYFTPRIDSYNFIYGYFPGFSYDEELTIGTPLLVFRAVTLVCAGAFAFAAARRTAVAGSLGALLVIAWFMRTDLDWESTNGSIAAELGSTVTTPHFVIHYDARTFTGEEIRRIAAEHEFRYERAAGALGVTDSLPISSFIYPDAAAKRRLTGAGRTDIAKPWRSEIHLGAESWDETLEHELVHVLAGTFGMPVIRAHYNTGLVEGLATALSPGFGTMTLREYAASMLKFGLVKDPGRLINPAGFAVTASTVSYVMMGAFCEYLIESRGIGKLKEWYGGGDPASIYGIGTDSLVSQWTASLAGVTVRESRRAHVEYFFKRPSIFARECARAIANINAEGRALIDAEEYAAAAAKFSEALDLSRNTASWSGLIRAAAGSRDFAAVMKLVGEIGKDTAASSTLAPHLLLIGDIHLLRGEDADAAGSYDAALRLDLSQGYSDAARLRLLLIAEDSLRLPLCLIISGMIPDSNALGYFELLPYDTLPPLALYARARISFRLGRYADAMNDLIALGAPFTSPDLNAAADELLGASFTRLGEYAAARNYFERALELRSDEAARRRVRIMLQRADWLAARPGGVIANPTPNRDI